MKAVYPHLISWLAFYSWPDLVVVRNRLQPYWKKINFYSKESIAIRKHVIQWQFIFFELWTGVNCSKNGFWYMTSLTPFNDNFYLDKYCTQSCSVNFSSKKQKYKMTYPADPPKRNLTLLGIVAGWFDDDMIFFLNGSSTWKMMLYKNQCGSLVILWMYYYRTLEDDHRSRECMQSGVCITLWKKVKKSLLFNCFQVKFLNKWLQNLISKSVSNHLGNL